MPVAWNAGGGRLDPQRKSARLPFWKRPADEASDSKEAPHGDEPCARSSSDSRVPFGLARKRIAPADARHADPPPLEAGGDASLVSPLAVSPSIRVVLKHLKPVSTLHPHSIFFTIWDTATFGLLLVCALETPFEVAFLTVPTFSALWWANRVIDLFFTIDICFNFMQPYQTKEMVWIRQPSRIAKHYIRTWLLVDIISVFPFDVAASHGDPESANASSLKILRIARLTRLFKMLRVLKAARIFRKWETSWEIDYNKLTLFKFGIIVLFMSHWLACAWHMTILVGDITDPGGDNWVNTYPELGADPSACSRFIAALYWAVVTLSTLGYGDIIPASDLERGFAAFAAIVGASLYAYLVGAVCGIVRHMNQVKESYYNDMDSLNKFMRERNMPQQLRVRLRDYIRFRAVNQEMASSAVMDSLSESLALQVHGHLHVPVLRRLKVFQDCSLAFLTDICLHLTAQLYSQDEMVIRAGSRADKLCILDRGICLSRARVFRPPAVFGESVVTQSMRNQYGVISLSHVRCLAITQEMFQMVMKKHPDMQSVIRRNVRHDIVRQKVLAYANIVRLGVNMNTENEFSTAQIEGIVGKEHLTILYKNKLSVMMREATQALRVKRAAVCLQQSFRIRKFSRLFLEALEKRSMLHPNALAFESTLLSHGLEKYVKVIVDDEHDLASLAMCTAGDLKQAYNIPMGFAARVLAEIRSSHSKSLPAPVHKQYIFDKQARKRMALCAAQIAVLLIHIAHERRELQLRMVQTASQRAAEDARQLTESNWIRVLRTSRMRSFNLTVHTRRAAPPSADESVTPRAAQAAAEQADAKTTKLPTTTPLQSYRRSIEQSRSEQGTLDSADGQPARTSHAGSMWHPSSTGHEAPALPQQGGRSSHTPASPQRAPTHPSTASVSERDETLAWPRASGDPDRVSRPDKASGTVDSLLLRDTALSYRPRDSSFTRPTTLPTAHASFAPPQLPRGSELGASATTSSAGTSEPLGWHPTTAAPPRTDARGALRAPRSDDQRSLPAASEPLRRPGPEHGRRPSTTPHAVHAPAVAGPDPPRIARTPLVRTPGKEGVDWDREVQVLFRDRASASDRSSEDSVARPD